MPSSKQLIGHYYETLALNLYLQEGYRLMRQNWHCRYGEIDLVLEHDLKTPATGSMVGEQRSELVFVEVRYKENVSYGYPEELVSVRKRKSLERCIYAYTNQGVHQCTLYRLDFISIVKLDGKITIKRFEGIS